MSSIPPQNSMMKTFGSTAGTIQFPGVEIDDLFDSKRRIRRIPRYHVILLDDDHHTYDYVIEMLTKVFGHNVETAFCMAVEVDSRGAVIVDTTTMERAEFKRDQIHAYGADWRIPRCKGSMSATIEPAEDLDCE